MPYVTGCVGLHFYNPRDTDNISPSAGRVSFFTPELPRYTVHNEANISPLPHPYFPHYHRRPNTIQTPHRLARTLPPLPIISTRLPTLETLEPSLPLSSTLSTVSLPYLCLCDRSQTVRRNSLRQRTNNPSNNCPTKRSSRRRCPFRVLIPSLSPRTKFLTTEP